MKARANLKMPTEEIEFQNEEVAEKLEESYVEVAPEVEEPADPLNGTEGAETEDLKIEEEAEKGMNAASQAPAASFPSVVLPWERGLPKLGSLHRPEIQDYT